MKVELGDEAFAQAEKIDAWWRANRLDAPDLFIAELERTLTLLEQTPTLGLRYPTKKRKGVRRLFLPRTNHHIYFVQQDSGLLVLSVWGASKRRGPF